MLASFRSWLRNGGRNRRPYRLTARQASARQCCFPLLEKLEDRVTPSTGLNDTYVAMLYRGLLGRPVEAGGLAYWTGRLSSGTSYTQVAQSILGSREYEVKQVQGLYSNLLGRAADDAGLNYWVQAEQTGTPSDQVIASILGSGEYYAHVGGTLDAFVRSIYRTELGRDLDPIGAAYFGTEVLTGTPRATVALQILRSTEAQQRQVSILYHLDLDRAPDAGGLAYWVSAMHGGLTAEGVSANLLGSGELVSWLQSYAANSSLTDPNAVAQQYLSSFGLLGGSQPKTFSPPKSTVISLVGLQAPDFVTREVPLVQVQVQANDPSLVDPTIHIDVDLNHNGSFTDPGERDFATGIYNPSSITVALSTPLARGTYSLRVRADDQIGGEATSAIVIMQVDPNAGFIGSQALLNLAAGLPYGTPLDGTFGNEIPVFEPGKAGLGGNNLVNHNSELFQFDAQGRVLVSVRSTLTKYLDGLVNDLKNLGMVVSTITPAQNMVTGYLPVGQILNLPNVAHFAAANPVWKPVYRSGSVDTQGDSLIKADTFRAGTGDDGKGVKVGVLSNSVNQAKGPGNLTGIAASQSTGDLPSRGVQVLKDGPAGSTDEGRAMLEIVYDIAPGANLAFYSPDSPQDFVTGIQALANSGSKVIADDIGFADSPMFNDGIIAQAANNVAANGVFYTSAAGNTGAEGWQGNWTPVQTTIGSETGFFQDFGGGSPFQTFTLPVGGSTQISLNWDSAFLEGGSPLPNFAVNNEIDAFVVNPANGTILATFNSNTMNTGEAFQFIDFTNDGTFGTNNFAFAFELRVGAAPTKLRWVVFSGDDPMALGEGAPTVFGQPAANGAVAVGAVNWRTPTVPESFTSLGGPLTILFDSNGNRLTTPEIRNKPDVTAPDGVFTSFFGQVQAGDSFPSFFGTSAAAPHVAGAAALLLQNAPGTAPSSLLQHLQMTAIDIPPTGFDPLTGAGLIQVTPITPGGGGGGGGGGQPGFPNDPFENNDTSDKATDFGSILTDFQQTFSNLTINLKQGLPDYDWFRMQPGVDGTFTANLSVTQGQGLEIHLWTLQDGYLTELGKAVANASTNNLGSISAKFKAGQIIFLEVKGINIAPGVMTTGQYDLALAFG